MRIAVVPGSFDPVTLGHVDIVTRAAGLFDEVVVGVARNASKQPLLTELQRRDAFAAAVAHLPNVRVDVVPGLLVDFCREVGAVALVKGLRGGADFDAEAPMAAMNRHLTGIETVFLVGDGKLQHIASSMVRDIGRYDGPIDDLVPAGVGDLVRAAYRAARSESGPGSALEAACDAHQPPHSNPDPGFHPGQDPHPDQDPRLSTAPEGTP